MDTKQNMDTQPQNMDTQPQNLDTKPQTMDTKPNAYGPNNMNMGYTNNMNMGNNASQTKRCHSDLVSGLLDRYAIIRVAVPIVSFLQIISGVIAIGTWSYMLAEAGKLREYSPLSVGVGIWAGFYALFPGAFGLVCWTKSLHVVVRMRCFYIHFGLSMGLFGIGSQLLRYALEGISCGLTDKYLPTLACFLNDTMKKLMYVNIAMGAFMLLTAVIVLVYYLYITCVELPKARRAAAAQIQQHNQPQGYVNLTY